MAETLTKEGMEYIIARLIRNANEAAAETRKDRKDQFNAGRNLAYYEMLDIIKSELEIREQDLKEFGLDFNLEKELL